MYIYIYIYIYCFPHTDCFVVSRLISVARLTRFLKLRSKPGYFTTAEYSTAEPQGNSA